MGKDNEKSKSNKKPSGSDKKTTAASKVKKSSKSTAGGSKVAKSETKSSKSTASKKSADTKSKNMAKKSSSGASKKSSTSSAGEKATSTKSNKQSAAAKQIKKAKAKPVPKPKPVETPHKEEDETAAEEDATQEEQQDSSSQASQSSSAASEQWEDGESTEGQEKEPDKPKEEELQFTKPTINQIKKDKKEKPLSMSEKITGREFESLNDDITELNSSVQMLKHSYGSIIKSLVAMQDRRSKKRAAKEAQKHQEHTFLTTLSTADPAKLKTPSCLAQADKYDIERFISPVTREETFNALFDEVAELNGRTEALRTNFYDQRGRFLRDKYEAQTEVRLDRAQFNEYKLWTKKLAGIVDDIARNYNDDLLNMFRLT